MVADAQTSHKRTGRINRTQGVVGFSKAQGAFGLLENKRRGDSHGEISPCPQ